MATKKSKSKGIFGLGKRKSVGSKRGTTPAILSQPGYSFGSKRGTTPAILSQPAPGQKRRRGPGKPFVKGDPRIYHEKGPKHFAALRRLALELSTEAVTSDGGRKLTIQGHNVEVIEAILRKWSASNDFQKQNKFVEIAYGKVPDEIIITMQDWEKIIDLLPIEFQERVANGEPVTEVLVAFLHATKARAEQSQSQTAG